MTVHAPFRFAPIHRWVWFPKWGDLVSHDVPFKDGISGEISLEITAKTPLLLGGPRRKPQDTTTGEVWPFETVDPETGKLRYALPGSALQGMIRSVLEIASFGKLGPWIDEKRFGVRDLTERAKPYYRNRLLNNVKAGFLSEQDGKWIIRECQLKRIEFENIPASRGAHPQWMRKSDAVQRYEWVKSTGPYKVMGEINRPCTLVEGNGGAWLVVTGNTGASASKAKKCEFVFVETASLETLFVQDDVRRDFHFIHENGNDDDRSKWNPTWRFFFEKGYPKASGTKSFPHGGEIPVFFIKEDGMVTSIGLAFMFKLAHQKTTHQLLQNSNKDHVDQIKLDLPSLIFGSIADTDAGTGVKRRASFDIAVADLQEGALIQRAANPAVLLEPKPSYFPIYVRQPLSENQRPYQLLPGIPYATYTPIVSANQYSNIAALSAEHRSPELAGVKIWPARPRFAATFPSLPAAPENAGNKVQVHLNALPAGTTFKTALRFHNLRAVELGAILWALTFADENALEGRETGLQHRIGMGKPYALGAVTFRLGQAIFLPNNPAKDNETTFTRLCENFVTHMTMVFQQFTTAYTWDNSEQVRALKKAADPNINTDSTQFTYMALEDYSSEKREGHFLPFYVEPHVEQRQLASQGNMRASNQTQRSEPSTRSVRPAPPTQRRPNAPPANRLPPAPGTRMLDIEENAWVTVLGAGSKEGTARVTYDEGGDEEMLPLNRLVLE